MESEELKILIDFSGWHVHKDRGIGRYLISLVGSLLKFNVSVDIILEATEEERVLLRELFARQTVGFIFTYEKPLEKMYDFFVVGDYFSSHSWLELKQIKNCKKIVGIVYDLIPLIFAKNYLNKNFVDDLKYAISLELIYASDHIFTISKSTKKDICEILKIEQSKVSVIDSGYSTYFGISEEEIKPYENRSKTILMISGDDRRKNYEMGLEGFLLAISTKKISDEFKLVIICKQSEEFKLRCKKIIKKFPNYIKNIVLTGFIRDKELKEYLKSSMLTLFPSKYEGLGLPILESFACGTPCIASNTSSCKDLVDQEFTFNPYDYLEISKQIANIINSKTIWNRCLSNGRKLLLNYNWEDVGKTFIQELLSLSCFSNNKKKLALFGCLPPEQSGIASYNFLLLAESPEIHSFLPYREYMNFRTLRLGANFKRCFSLSLYDFISQRYDYKNNIFVLGNSVHNVSILSAAIKMAHNNNWLYLHEAQLGGLFEEFCKSVKIDRHSVYKLFYGEKLASSSYGILPLIRLTGVKNIIVNNEKCRKLVEADGVNEKPVVTQAFHPIENNLTLKKSKPFNCSEFIIGSFGIPQKAKATEEIISAVSMLIEKGFKVKLLLAGYQINSYFANRKLPSWLITIDSPSKSDLLKLQAGTSIAVQLRNDSHGESSGVINTLIGMGVNLITTENFVDEALRPFVKEVPRNITAVQLHLILQDYIEGKMRKDFYNRDRLNDLLMSRSFKSLSRFLINLPA